MLMPVYTADRAKGIFIFINACTLMTIFGLPLMKEKRETAPDSWFLTLGSWYLVLDS
jgi:hypothetical protein